MERPPVDRWARTAWRGLTDPRVVGAVQALPRTIGVLRRTAAARGEDGYAPVAPSAGLAAQIFLDEILISVMRNPALFPSSDEYERAGRDVALAYEMWHSNGWLDHPVAFHEEPSAPSEISLTSERTFRRQRFEHLAFRSDYQPRLGEPGADRYIAHVENRTAHAYLVRSPVPARPWLVCLHGFGMGIAHVDLAAFRAERLSRELGLNLALVVLPMHGPRQTPGTRKGEGFMSIDLLDSVHGMAQAASDTRSVIRWIRSQDDHAAIGVYGLSLGGYVAALVASLEAGLACVIAGVPATDLPDLYRRHSPDHVRIRAYESGALGDRADAVHGVVSPLALVPKLPVDRRFIFAGAGDRMSTAGQARRLWEHWERPQIAWYPGGHIGFFLAGGVQRFVREALQTSGLVQRREATEADHSDAEDLPAGA